jgi:polyhydroxybutyrate depolymerase
MKKLLFIFIFLPFLGLGQQLLYKSIIHDNLQRDYIIHVPSSYDINTAVPLVFCLHGYGGDSFSMSYTNFNFVSDTAGFIVVYPQGTLLQGTTHWNVGGWTNSSTTDDVSLIDFLIELISQDYNLNQDRIYATGMSNGGFFSFLLGCQMSNKFAAVASVTGSMTTETFNECNPERALPILQIHGTDDSIVTYNGNSSIGSIGIPEVLTYWSSNNYCNDVETTQLNDSNPNDDFSIERLLFDGGINGSVVDHYKVNGGEHVWFMTEDINSSELIF